MRAGLQFLQQNTASNENEPGGHRRAHLGSDREIREE